MVKHWKLTLLAIVSYVLFMVLLSPAAWWVKLIDLPAGVKHGPVSGTLWQGSVAGVQYQQLQLPNFSWQLNGWQLFTGNAELALTGGNKQLPLQPFIAANVRYGITGTKVADTLVRWPVADIVPLLPLPLPVQATGELVLDITKFSYGHPWCEQLTGVASWQDAALQTPNGTWLELQSLFGELSCADGTVVLTTDGANRLGLDIKAVLNAEQLLVNGTIKPEADMPKEVHQAMQFVGKPDEQGRYRISF